MAARGTLESGARLLAATGRAARTRGDGVLAVRGPDGDEALFCDGAAVPPPGVRALRRGSAALDALVENTPPALRRLAVELPPAAREPAGHGLAAAPDCTLETLAARDVREVRWAVLYRREARGPCREDALFTAHASAGAVPRIDAGTSALERLLALASLPAARPAPDALEAIEPSLRDADTLARDDAEAFARARDSQTVAALAAELRQLGEHYAAAADECAEEERAGVATEWRARRDALLVARRLRVRVLPVALVAVRVPERVFALTLRRGDQAVALETRVNLATGESDAPACSACGQPAARVALCPAGAHAVCQTCERRCSGCGLAFCAACGARECAFGAEVSCPRCGARCDTCGREACETHRRRCESCRAEACSECGATCDGCGSYRCRTHLRACARCERDRCTQCLVPCAACGEDACRDDRGECASCGRVHCRACLSSCERCGAALCADDARAHGCPGTAT